MVREGNRLIPGIVHSDFSPVVGSVNPCSSLTKLARGVVMAEYLLVGEDGPEGVHHVEDVEQSGQAGRFLGLRVVCAVNVVSDTVYITPYQTRW